MSLYSFSTTVSSTLKISPSKFMTFLAVSNKSFGSYLSLSQNLFTLSCDKFPNISANLQHPPYFGSDSKNRV